MLVPLFNSDKPMAIYSYVVEFKMFKSVFYLFLFLKLLIIIFRFHINNNGCTYIHYYYIYIIMWTCPGNMPKYYPGLRDILPDRRSLRPA